MSREALEHWQRQMRSAQSEAALLAVVGSYLATLSHEQLSRLPESSRPTPIADREDIAALNVQIARDELMYTGDDDVAVLLRQMVVVLSEATKRLAQFSLDSQLPRQGQ
jgi:hypothetical protein